MRSPLVILHMDRNDNIRLFVGVSNKFKDIHVYICLLLQNFCLQMNETKSDVTQNRIYSQSNV